MPAVISTVVPPDSHVPLPGAPRHHHGHGLAVYIVALSTFAVFAVVRVAASTSASSLLWLKLSLGRGRDLRKDYGRNALAPFASVADPGPQGSGHKQRLPIWPLAPTMEKSRGVSNGGADDLSQDDTPAARGETGGSAPLSPDSDGDEGEFSTMDGAGWSGSHRGASAAAGMLAGGATIVARRSIADMTGPRSFQSRSPPPPPLTPPNLSTTSVHFEERRHSYAISVPPGLYRPSSVSFVHPPNPDFLDDPSVDASTSLPATPRRPSFANTGPIAISAANSGAPGLASAKDAFAPSSFPSSSSILPPPPPSHNHDALYAMAYDEEEIDVDGEVILGRADADAGTGWTRHTRVYGGGVCLACMAAGGGGFYGDRVPPEHKR